MYKSGLILASFILWLSSSAIAQNAPTGLKQPPPPRPSSPLDGDLTDQDMNLPPDMRARLAIERAESRHREALEDVEKLTTLSADVAKKYEEAGTLSSEDMKKVGSIEKLAKDLLNHAGGSKVDDDIEKITLADAIKQMDAAVTNIHESMTAETRYVVSAKVIGLSNEVINLARYIRRAGK